MLERHDTENKVIGKSIFPISLFNKYIEMYSNPLQAMDVIAVDKDVFISCKTLACKANYSNIES